LAKNATNTVDYNYLGLEIRPSVAEYARSRVEKHGLDGRVSFVGCNVNVDLDRVLSEYNECNGGRLGYVCIQFPDPHFKNRHKKRRVVDEDLVMCLSRHCEPGVEIFLQSDVKFVLDDMRARFREFGKGYFDDEVESTDLYVEENPLEVRTEREVSVLIQGLPVYRTLFRRTALVMEKN